jgi:sigma-54 dependent transcriptional regulator, acetoin dehydrogenase operon transcriptional activator AcoR
MNRLDSTLKPNGQTLKDITEEAESKHIQETLGKFGNDMEGRKKTANSLGVSLATLYNKMKKYRII